MKREEEKREAARKYATHDVDTDETDFYGNYVKKEDFVLPEYNAFLEGCKWSDENPKSSWISVLDDLPCNHKELLSGEHNTKGVEVVFQDRGSGKRRVEVRSMIKGIQNRNSKGIVWYWNAYWDADIIYWRPIPEPPSD